jgi:hypothetical protein
MDKLAEQTTRIAKTSHTRVAGEIPQDIALQIAQPHLT